MQGLSSPLGGSLGYIKRAGQGQMGGSPPYTAQLKLTFPAHSTTFAENPACSRRILGNITPGRAISSNFSSKYIIKHESTSACPPPNSLIYRAHVEEDNFEMTQPECQDLSLWV